MIPQTIEICEHFCTGYVTARLAYFIVIFLSWILELSEWRVGHGVVADRHNIWWMGARKKREQAGESEICELPHHTVPMGRRLNILFFVEVRKEAFLCFQQFFTELRSIRNISVPVSNICILTDFDSDCSFSQEKCHVRDAFTIVMEEADKDSRRTDIDPPSVRGLV